MAGATSSMTPNAAAAGSGQPQYVAGGAAGSTGSQMAGTSSGGAAGMGGENAAGASTMMPQGGSDAGQGCESCVAYAQTSLAGTMSDANLNALSGIAASFANPGVLYLHNDRDQPEFFAVSESGALLATFTLSGATVLDIEDIAVGPCPEGSCVYLGDLGDNVTPRLDSVFRAPEPVVGVAMPGVSATLEADELVFSYPDGTRNAESLLIDHASSNLYVITKVAAGMPSTVYRLPGAFGAAAAAATKVQDLTVPGAADTPATAADAHPCGTAFLLRTMERLEYLVPTRAGRP